MHLNYTFCCFYVEIDKVYLVMYNMRYNLEDMGAQISKRRTELKLSQEQTAEAVNISVAHLSGIENGKSNFTIEILLKLCDLFDVTPDYFIYGGNNSLDNGFIEAVTEKLHLCRAEDRALLMSIINSFIDDRYRRKESEE